MYFFKPDEEVGHYYCLKNEDQEAIDDEQDGVVIINRINKVINKAN
jgi:hypothetical protein